MNSYSEITESPAEDWGANSLRTLRERAKEVRRQFDSRARLAQELKNTAGAMVAEGKGILAMDESNGTCNRRFEKLGIATTEENRRAYREIILTTPNLSNYISGAILYDETIRQSTQEAG
jgi:hypothetical protein